MKQMERRRDTIRLSEIAIIVKVVNDWEFAENTSNKKLRPHVQDLYPYHRSGRLAALACRSEQAMAYRVHCWESANGLPNEIASMLRPHGGEVDLLLAMPEYKVPLPGSSRGESQNDIFALARAGDRTFAIMVEGKVREPFGETLHDWLQNASDGKRERLAFICDLLGLTLPLPGHIYYQLLHRTASAVIEAQRFKTDAAAMIVHSFSQEKTWFEAFVQFASLFDVAIAANELSAVPSKAVPSLYIGWACGDCKFLSA